MAKYLKYIFVFLGAFIVLLLVFAYFYLILPFWGIPFNAQRHSNLPLTPAWALEPWIWEDDVVTAQSTLELINGYREHDFPADNILIDSPWSLRYNDFIVDETRFPNPAAFFGDLQQRGIRVMLWMTSMVNRESSDTAIRDSADWHKEAAEKGYLVGNGDPIRWWKGKGGQVDYTHPQAMAWWRNLQQQVFDWGIDGWKLDGAATNFHGKAFGVIPCLYQRVHSGWMTTRGYMDHYYRDEYRHGLTQNPEFVTMSRSLDSVLPWGHPEGFAPHDASPLNWVGDNKHTWSYEERGLERAIWCILRSAKLGYNIIGSDIGGYHGGSNIPAELYIRWTQFSTFCGFFLNGGHGERRMWKRTPMELELIRRYSWLHSELVPYIYCYSVQGHRGESVLMRPLKEKYHYFFGDWLLIAPIFENSNQRTVTLPEGKWRYWFDDKIALDGGKTFSRSFPLEEYPVYIRDGAILPMHIRRAYTHIGSEEWGDYLTLNIYPCGSNRFTVHHADSAGEMNVQVEEGNPLIVTLKGRVKPHLLRILVQKAPSRIEKDGKPFAAADWEYEEENQRVIIKSDLALSGKYAVFFER